MGTPTKALIQQARCALRYLWGTKDHKLVFSVSHGSSIAAGCAGTAAVYIDADWANCAETRGSISGFVIMVYGTAVAWCSKKQPVLAKSTMGAEYIAASMATDEALMVIKLLK
jgi:predicted secreted hydrolase